MNRIAPIALKIEGAISCEDSDQTGSIAPIAPDIDSAIFRENLGQADRIALIAPNMEGAIGRGNGAPASEIAPIAPEIEGAISTAPPAAAAPDDAPVTLVVGGLLVRGGEVLLGRRSRHRRICPDTWDMIGGHVEAGEGLEAALARELGEEIGIVPIAFSPVATIDFSAEAGRPVHFHVFRIDAWRGETAIRNHEHVDLRWFDLEAACALPDLASARYPAVFREALKRAGE